MNLIATFVSILLLIGNIASAGQIKDDFSLKEKCGELSKSRFASEFGTGISIVDNQAKTTSSYESHYNNKLNTCMMLITTDIISDETETKVYIYDIIENKEYGSLVVRMPNKVLICWVLNKTCKSVEGWEKLIKPFMSE